MRNLKLKIAYSGKQYHGFQIQKNALTVQEVLQTALETLLKHKIELKGCSRTDVGVHAYEYFVSFKTSNPVPTERLVVGLNTLLPGDVVANHCEEVAACFHARYDVVFKEYIYKILNCKVRNPFLDGFVYWYPFALDVGYLDELTKCFIGRKDFKAFCASGSKQSDFVRTIYEFEACKSDDMICFRVAGDGFLYNMVRIMVGTLIEYCRQNKTKSELNELIESGFRERAGKTAPSGGLYLNKVIYNRG